MSYDVSDEELEAIKQRKLLELQKRLEEEERRRQQMIMEARRQEILRTILTPKARERLSNIRLVRPELARAIEDQLITLAQAGRIRVPITDEEVKRLLEQIYHQTHREIRIRFKQK